MMVDEELQRGGDLASVPPVPATGRVYFVESSSSTRDVFCADVEIGSVNDLFAVAFQLQYDTDVMTFDSFTPGPFLGTGAETLVQVDAEENPTSGVGTLTVGVSRRAGLGGVVGCSSGCGNELGSLITLCWRLQQPGSSPLTFTGNLAGFDPDGTDPANQVIGPSDFVSNAVLVQ